MASTKNFNPKQDKKLSCTCGKTGCDKRSVNQPTLDKLQKVRDLAGIPMVINSGGRCPLHNNEVHRKIPADHQKCIGVDVRVRNDRERELWVKLGLKAGFTAIGVARGFVHLGNRNQNRLSVWDYGSKDGNISELLNLLYKEKANRNG